MLAGGILQLIIPASILPHPNTWWVAGLVVILLGVALAIWAVITAGGIHLERPASLVTDGAYAFSRNPMYLAWGIFSAGFSLVINSLWLAMAALAALLYLNFTTIPKEEQALQRNFGAVYEVYRKHVRRWL
jgi:protein-S-isoprenylcysteine O-methyltransferase Ste14